MKTNPNILVAMSGGVDSAVTALLLQQEGYTLEGATMRLFSEKTDLTLADRACGTTQNIEDAKAVCEQLGFSHEVFDFSAEFAQAVLQNFVTAYAKGLTPNPCTVCNRRIKFDAFLQAARERGIPDMATGHYARIEKQGDRYLLKKAIDKTKDQSYVLYALKPEQLAHIHLPLGGYQKSEIRDMAKALHFRSAERKESQDICFVPDKDYAAFIERFSGKTFAHGSFVTADGQVLGEHKGIIHYTIGQRRGLGLALPKPMYVVKKDVQQNTVVLGYTTDLFSKTMLVHDLSFTATDALLQRTRLEVKIRYAHEPQPAFVEQIDTDTVRVEFVEPQRAITAGQAAVFYDGDTVVGGGTIAAESF